MPKNHQNINQPGKIIFKNKPKSEMVEIPIGAHETPNRNVRQNSSCCSIYLQKL